MSATRVMIPEANISCKTSISVVIRVMRRPTGFRSKVLIGSFCT